LFRTLVRRFAAQVQLETQVCPGLVEAVERGALKTPETRALLQRYLHPMTARGIDHLVLGCTHYPFLSEMIAEIVGPTVTLVDPAPAVARQVGRLLKQYELHTKDGQPPTHRFYTSGDRQRLVEMAKTLVNYAGPVHSIQWTPDGADIHPIQETVNANR
jgi:glutamate racemase